MSWDVCFEIEAEKNYGDQREISQDFLDFVIVEEEEEELSIIEEKFAPILRELIRMGREIDIDLKEIKRRIKTIASNADKIKGGVDSEIGMRSVATTMTKTKLDIIKERAGIIKMTEELKIKMANAGTGGGSGSGGEVAGSSAGKFIARSQKMRDGKGTIANNIFDSPGGMYNPDGTLQDPPKTEENSGIYVNNDEEYEPTIEYEPIGSVSYKDAAINTKNLRQCQKDTAPPKIEEVMYYDEMANRYWVATVDENGNEVAGRRKPLVYFINSNIDTRNMRAEDETGSVYRVIERNAEDMPEDYVKEWDVLGNK